MKEKEKQKQNILLTGFMGAGKSAVARELAQATGLFAVDTDDLIESVLQCPIREYFAKEGEPAFRRQEQKVADWIAASVDHTIIATGGGFFAVQGFMKLGTVVFLDADFATICRHLGVHADSSAQGNMQTAIRPLFNNPEEARNRYDARQPLYRKYAHYTVTVGSRTPADLAEEIVAIIRSRGRAR